MEPVYKLDLSNVTNLFSIWCVCKSINIGGAKITKMLFEHFKY